MATFIQSAKSSGDWMFNKLMAYNVTSLPTPPGQFCPALSPSLDNTDPTTPNSPLGNAGPSLIRSAKSSSDWTLDELKAYNVTISPTPPDKFFSAPDPSLDHIDPTILNSPLDDTDPSLSIVTSAYLNHLYLAARVTQENYIDDFTTKTLNLLGFNGRHSLVVQHHTIPLSICGDTNHATQMDVCLLHTQFLVPLLLVKCKTISDRGSPRAQVVAQAIAAFQLSNQRRSIRDLPHLDTITIPCITMVGTRPTFYLVPVTETLSNAAISGQYPATRTEVLECVTVPAHGWDADTEMEDTGYRKLALRRFLAFKTLAESHWRRVLEGV